MPCEIFSSSTRWTLSSMRLSVRRPSVTAASRAVRAVSMSGMPRRMSPPASRNFYADLAVVVARKRAHVQRVAYHHAVPAQLAAEDVRYDGLGDRRGLGVHQGDRDVAHHDHVRPGLDAGDEGQKLAARSSSRLLLTTAAPSCVSVEVSPWPGKCLRQQMTPASVKPRTAEATSSAACSKSSE